MLSLFLVSSLFVLAVTIVYMYRDGEQLRRALHRYDDLVSKEDFQRQLDVDIRLKKKQIAELAAEQDDLKIKVSILEQKECELKEETYLQSFGFYQPKYDFITFGEYETELKRVKLNQKEMIRKGTAAICHTDWIMKDSQKDGQKMTKNFLKLVLITFNTECDDIIFRVKHSNVDIEQVKQKIVESFDKLNKLSEIRNCEITNEYLELKIDELELNYDSKRKKQEIKDKKRESVDEERERQKQEKIARDIQKAEEREIYYEQAIQEAVLKQKLMAGVERDRMALQIQKLEQKLVEATSERRDAVLRSEQIKAGVVYVVSNIGSFGRDQEIYRIFKTTSRRPDEIFTSMRSVVPFPFDVHLKIDSEDVSDTIYRLHQHFQHKRVNLANERRDFFNVSLEEIFQAVNEIARETDVLTILEFEKVPQAYEYRRTQAEFKRRNQESSSNSRNLGDEIA